MKNFEIAITVGMNIGEFELSDHSEHKYGFDDASHKDAGRHGKDIAVNAELKFGIEEMESETTPEEVKGLFDLLGDLLHKEVRTQIEEQLEPVPQEEETVEVPEPPTIIIDDILNPKGWGEL